MKKMSEISDSFLAGLEGLLLRFPKVLVFLVCVACGFSLYYTARNLGINTDTTKILSKELPFLQDRSRFLQAFPQDDAAILVVVDGATPERATQALAYLGEHFRQDKEEIEAVYIPGEGEFFDRHGLLYLDLDELNALAAKLVEAQPFIGSLSKDNSLKSLLSIIGLAITSADQDLPVNLKPLLDSIQAVIRGLLDGTDRSLSWQQLMFGDDQDLLTTTQRFILLNPVLDFNALVPAEKALQSVRAIVDNAKRAFPDVSIRLTGEVVLEHDELESVQRSAQMASLFSMILVCTALLIGLRSLKLVLITFTVLLVGLILTAGFATLAIGHLNLISVSFAVLYIGIGVDYSIQISLRYQELLQQNVPQQQALMQAVRKVRPSIGLCAVTTAIGFFSFIPTAYTGVSELGVIAGGGMLIAFIISVTVLPALLQLFPLKPKVKDFRNTFPDWIYDFPIRHGALIKWTALGLTLAGLGLLTQVRFDFNPLNLRDPASESVATFKELLKTKTTSPMTLTILAANEAEARTQAQQLQRLPSVENALTIFDFIPEHQTQKLDLIQELALVMGLRSEVFPPLQQDSAENHRTALTTFKRDVEKSLKDQPDSHLAASMQSLDELLQRLLTELEAKSRPEQSALLDRLQQNLLGTLPDTMNKLMQGLNADVVTLERLPQDLSERWLSKGGIYRVQVFPSKNLDDHQNLKEFIAEVRQIAPNATDLPVIYLESGNAVVKAFQQALMGAFVAITLVLLLATRSIKDTFLILLPLSMTAILTGAATVVLNTPFNFANIIVIPLLFGLGVDSGIYIMNRLRNMPDQTHSVLQTSTARGVIFSSLTTLCSLVSMAFTPHLGLASMGLLLSIGLVLIVVCTMLVLPAVLTRPIVDRQK
ncbi:MMPL family transporter [Methylobacter svalbardensis]|uniref:MMPL family transporter n=1 Tax=Methylobacter svalbardensis TaxID=3080016 RepID=UPI0030ECA020